MWLVLFGFVLTVMNLKASDGSETLSTVRSPEGLTNNVNRVSDIDVAERALKDGLFDIAQNRAQGVLFAKDSDCALRKRAFSVVMSIYERSASTNDWLKVFEMPSLDGRPLPMGDTSSVMLRDYWHARALIRAGRKTEAAAILDLVHRVVPSQDVIEIPVLRLLAYALASTGRRSEAIAMLEEKVDGNPEVALDLGRIFLHDGKFKEAAKTLSSIEDSAGDPFIVATASLLRAKALQDGGDVTNALKHLASMRQSKTMLSPDFRALALSSEAIVISRDSIDAKSVGLAEEAVATAESAFVRLDCEMTLAEILAMCGLDQKAAACTRRLVEMAPRSFEVASTVKNVADALNDAGLYDVALGEYSLYLSSFSGTSQEAEVQRGRAKALMGLGRQAEAAAAFLKAGELCGNDQDCKMANLYSAAEAQKAAGFFKQAISTIALIVASNPSVEMLAAARLLEAESLVKIDSSAATEAFLKVGEGFANRPEGTKALFRAAELIVLADSKSPSPEFRARAISLYERAASSADPQIRASSLLGIGLIRQHAGQYAEALASFDAAARVEDGGGACEQARLMGAEALLALGRAEEATASVSELIRTRPDSLWYRDAVFWMGRRSFNSGDYTGAEKYFAEFVSQWAEDSKADSALLFEAHAQFQQKKFQMTVDTVVKLVAAYPDSNCLAYAQFIQAEAMCEILQFDAAVLIYDVVIETAKDQVLRLGAMGRRGDCLFTLGADNSVRYAESIKAYEAVLADPAVKQLDMILQCEYKIGRSLEKSGRTGEAKDRYYTRVVLRFEQEQAKAGVAKDSPARIWYARAVLGVAGILERREDFDSAIAMLSRLSAEDYPGAGEAIQRIQAIQEERRKFGSETTNP